MTTMWTAIALFGMLTAFHAPPPASTLTGGAPIQAAAQSDGQLQLKVTVVLSRFQGDKKIGTLPYVFGLSGPGLRTNLRMGVDVPVPVNPRTQKPDAQPVSYTYRPVGTNIDCTASVASGGGYILAFVIEDTSIHLDSSQKPGTAISAAVDDVPSFRSFRTSFSATLRDGQTTQHTSATDPVTGEVIRIDITLNVVK